MDGLSNGPHYFYDSVKDSFIPFHQAESHILFNSQRSGEHHVPVTDELGSPFSPLIFEGHTSDLSRSLRKDGTLRRGSPRRVPRPRNAFMIFRSEFTAGEKIKRTVEHDNRQISKIVGLCWNQMTKLEKHHWFLKADEEKLEHLRKHPNYRFVPKERRAKKPVRRSNKRNGEEDNLRCRRVAELLLSGKEGDELEDAIKSIDSKETHPAKMSTGVQELSSSSLGHGTHSPPFRSPLLPPAGIAMPSSASSVDYSEFYSPNLLSRSYSGQNGSIPNILEPSISGQPHNLMASDAIQSSSYGYDFASPRPHPFDYCQSPPICPLPFETMEYASSVHRAPLTYSYLPLAFYSPTNTLQGTSAIYTETLNPEFYPPSSYLVSNSTEYSDCYYPSPHRAIYSHSSLFGSHFTRVNANTVDTYPLYSSQNFQAPTAAGYKFPEAVFNKSFHN